MNLLRGQPLGVHDDTAFDAPVDFSQNRPAMRSGRVDKKCWRATGLRRPCHQLLTTVTARAGR
ncbi:hypothetical protein ACH4SK_03785 [Streptomyces inhibens]|uniref:hypothetical protein n=1 Tax=Streptomyces inhibens TaxID=2293571 RepID=UPI0037AABA40